MDWLSVDLLFSLGDRRLAPALARVETRRRKSKPRPPSGSLPCSWRLVDELLATGTLAWDGWGLEVIGSFPEPRVRAFVTSMLPALVLVTPVSRIAGRQARVCGAGICNPSQTVFWTATPVQELALACWLEAGDV